MSAAAAIGVTKPSARIMRRVSSGTQRLPLRTLVGVRLCLNVSVPVGLAKVCEVSERRLVASTA
jgi:hypothetical protein